MTDRRLTTAELARQLGVHAVRARIIADRYAWLSKPEGDPPTYDPAFVTRYNAMRRRPHLSIEPPHRDWLTQYLGATLMANTTGQRRRRVVDLPVDGAAGGIDPNAQVNPAAEALDDEGNPEAELLIYPGELLSTSTTLAITLPGDTKESYFGSKHVGIAQEGETAEDVILRGIDLVNTSVEANVRDNLERWTPPEQGAE